MRSSSFWMFRVTALAGALALMACGPSNDGVGNNNGWNSNFNQNSGLDGGVQPDAFQFPDAAPSDAGNIYQLDGTAATDACPPNMQNPCSNPIGPGCGPTEVCGNGLDDDCNGDADEYCPCAPGSVQPCFIGPPGRVDQGACVRGTQTCQGQQEFGTWGPCEGGIWPTPEVCDDLDNDCNGCADDGLCCTPPISCPGPGDILPGQPFTTYQLDGTQWYTGTATSWNWEVTGGPCDDVFIAAGHPPSYTINGANTATPTIDFSLSGDYTVTMTVVTPSGTHTCTFIIHIIGPGLRVELCWPDTGMLGKDLDLHLLRNDLGANWCDSEDCYYSNCKAFSSDASRPDWGYADSPLSECVGGPEGTTWQSVHNHCDNPRLDIDNIFHDGIPENINVDNPNDGDTFRVMVHYFSGSGTAQPVVNIYCDGSLLGSYGQPGNLVTGFTTAGSFGCMGHTWRVVDVETLVSGGVTTCNLNVPIPGSWDVRMDDTSY